MAITLGVAHRDRDALLVLRLAANGNSSVYRKNELVADFAVLPGTVKNAGWQPALRGVTRVQNPLPVPSQKCTQRSIDIK